MRGDSGGASGSARYRPFVSEDEVGITEFSSPDLGGIGGRLKLLPADFIVEELPSEHWQQLPDDDSEPPAFLEFTLHKTRLGTLSATTELAAELGVPPASFMIAGLKDSHALTTQRVSCRRSALDEAAIRAAADTLPRLAVEDFRFERRPLQIGHTSGNRFRLALRDLLTDERATEAVVSAVRERGFINYYGLQRFGHTGTRNPAVGRAYLARQYKEMVNTILGFQPWGCASAKEAAARNAWHYAHNGRLALQLMPAHCSLERHVLTMLQRLESPDVTPASQHKHRRRDEEADCRRAVLSIPLQTRMLFGYSYFNVLWNKMASERLRRYGLKAVEGDCVIADLDATFGDDDDAGYGCGSSVDGVAGASGGAGGGAEEGQPLSSSGEDDTLGTAVETDLQVADDAEGEEGGGESDTASASGVTAASVASAAASSTGTAAAAAAAAAASAARYRCCYAVHLASVLCVDKHVRVQARWRFRCEQCAVSPHRKQQQASSQSTTSSCRCQALTSPILATSSAS